MRRIFAIIALACGLCAMDAAAQTNNLHFFSMMGDYDNVAHLINRHEDVDAFDDNGYTPLMYAADKGYDNIVKILMENGANPNWLPLYDYEPPALHAAVLTGHPQTVDLMLQYERTKVDLLDSAGYTALFHAAKCGLVECADVLLFHGADPNIVYCGSVTALQQAAANNDTAMINLLISNGADVDLMAGGRTAFSVAAEFGASDAADMLRNANCDIHKGYPMHFAAIYADWRMAEDLKNWGVDVNEPGIDKRLPRDMAVFNSNGLSARKIASMGGRCASLLMIRYLSISAFQEFCKHEFRLGFDVGVHEQRSNMSLHFGASLRPGYKPALVQDSKNLYYQLREKRRMLHFDLEKRISFTHKMMPDWGALLAYEFAMMSGKYDGAMDLKPVSENLHVPCVGLYGRFRYVGMSVGYKHYGYSHALESPKNVVNISITGYIGLGQKVYKGFN
ncbi:MAG: ankyrin repeat domain-containing protein [Bacteroidales bacterium]|nr:ankyrin repeat domain-containing protein [Bacteroidales bacterium]